MYRALSWLIDCPRDSSIDWNIDNARAKSGTFYSELEKIETIATFVYHKNTNIQTKESNALGAVMVFTTTCSFTAYHH